MSGLSRHGALILTALVCTFAAGCAGTMRPRYMFDLPSTLLKRYKAHTQGLTAISAEARVDQRGEKGRIRGTVLMFAKDSGEVRFDVMTQFGPVMILTSDGQTFALADMREHRFLTGPTCAANISRLLRLPLSAQQAAKVLLGGAPDIPARTQSLAWDEDESLYRLTQTTADGTQQVLHLSIDPRDEKAPLDSQRILLRAVYALSPTGQLLWEAHYSEHSYVKSQGGQQFEVPFEVRVLQPSSDTDTLIKFKDIRPNPEIPEGVFTQPVPAGMTAEEALCE